MTVAITGHRPNKLNNEYNGGPLTDMIFVMCQEILREIGATHAISGMALGVDTTFAKACINMDLPFTAAVPFRGQEKMWPQHAQKMYHWLLSKAAKVVHVSEPGYNPHKMQIRNQWMVDHADALITVWDGTPGGTANCVHYAQSKGIRTIPIDIQSLKNALR